jgi:hypothetical protein
MLSGVRSEAEERNEASAFFTFLSTAYSIYIQVLITIEIRTNVTELGLVGNAHPTVYQITVARKRKFSVDVARAMDKV